jgi:kinesin family protein 6/9
LILQALVKKYEREIKELKQELAMHDTLVGRTGVAYEPLNDTARFELQKAVKGFLENEENEIEASS